MKNIFVILCICFPFLASSQGIILSTDTVKMIPGEYQLYMIRNGHAYGSGGGATGQGTNTGPLGSMIAVQFANGTNPRIYDGGSGLHSGFLIVDSTDFQVYGTGLDDGCWMGKCNLSGANNFVAIAGATNVREIWCSALPGEIDTSSFVLMAKWDGTVWRLGTKTGGIAGDGTNHATGIDSTLVQITGLAHIKQMAGMFMPIAVDSSGNVYDWGGGNFFGIYLGRTGTYLSPAQVTIPGNEPITEVAGGEYTNYARGANGHLYAWGFYTSMMGIHVPFSSNGQYTTATDITASMQLGPHRSVLHIAKMHTSSSAIIYDSVANDSLFTTWGDNPEGSVGVGNQINYFTTTNPFEWDEGRGENVVDSVNYPIACLTNAAEIYNGGYYVLYNMVKTRDNKIYFAGRQKNGLANSIDGDPVFAISAIYPDFNNDSIFRQINFFATTNWKVQCPWCKLHPTALDCSNYTPPSGSDPIVNAGSNFSTPLSSVTLSGSSSSSYTHISQNYWSTTTCGVSISNPFSLTPTVSGLPSGITTLTLQSVDSFDLKASASIQIDVTAQTGYYFDTAGSDGNICSFALPCKTITKFNSVYATLGAGDTCYLKANETFIGQIVASTSGAVGNPIVTTRYGSGAEPIVGGMNPLTGWSNVGSNVWQAAFTGIVPNFITINGQLQNVSRTPNLQTGYFIPSSMGTNTITDATNSGILNIGDSIIARTSAFTVDKRKVTGNSSGIITVNTNFTYSGQGGLGWFKINTRPDVIGEYRDSANYIQVFSLSSPTGVLLPNVDTPLLSEGTNQVWDHIHFQGGNNSNVIVAFQQNSNTVFSYDTLDYGFDGLQFRSYGNWKFFHCFVSHFTDDGFQKQNSNNYNDTLTYDTLYDIGMRPGMGGSGNSFQFYSGIIAGDSGSVVKFCQLDSIGYIGIANYGSGFQDDSNYVNKFCQILEDGAAHYTWISSSGTFFKQRQVISNVTSNGGSYLSHNGVSLNYSSAACGYYADNYSNNILYNNNSCFNVNSVAYFDHGPSNIFTNNSAFGSGWADFLGAEISGGPVITGLIVKYNTFGSVTSTIPAIRFTSVNNDLGTFGSEDSNFLAGIPASTLPYYTFSSSDPGTFRTQSNWNFDLGYGAHSIFTTANLLYLYNPSGVNLSATLYGEYQYMNANFHLGSLTIGPYQSTLFSVITSGQIIKPEGQHAVLQ